jgi:anionic cell wall polymer biosynthesis LytR-Cps2A-Psr (LCP) family protein
MQQMLSAGTLTDQAKLTALTDAAAKSIIVSPGLDILTLVRHLSSMASGKIEFVTIPVVAVGARNDRGQSIITVDLPQVKQYVAGLLGRPAPSFASKGPLRLNGAVARQQQQPAVINGVRCVD